MSELAKHKEVLFKKIHHIVDESRHRVLRAVNGELVRTYWKIGRLIVEDEQQGETRAAYGKQLMRELSSRLTGSFGKGYSSTNIKYMKSFYLAFPQLDIKGHTLCDQLSWSHFRLLMRIENEAARDWYAKEAIASNWSVRALERQIGALFYERLLASNDHAAVEKEAEGKLQDLEESPQQLIRDPYVLEFLGLPGSGRFLESDLEQGLMDHLQSFLLELGRGFAFVGRQQRISTESKDFYVDLVFYNFRLKCFVLIDLKRNELTHQDIGQMDMYVRMFDDMRRDENDNPTVGMILCTGTDESVVHYSVLKDNERLFASTYQLVLPNEEELRAELERERRFLQERGSAE